MNNSYIINETTDIFESLGSYDSLMFAYHLLSLALVDIAPNIETETDVADYNKLSNCITQIKEVIDNNKEDEPREPHNRCCSECGKAMTEGYCIENGLEYYCTDECLHKHYTAEEFNQLYDDGDGDTYWTEWDENY